MESRRVEPESVSRPRFHLKPSNFLSAWTFAWIWKLSVLVRFVDAKQIDLVLCNEDTASVNGDLLGKNFADVQTEGGPNKVRRALFRTYGWRYAVLGFWKIAWGCFTWLGAYWLLKKVIEFAEDSAAHRKNPLGVDEPEAMEGHAYALALLGASCLQSISIHQLLSRCNKIGVQIRAGLMAMVFRKSLKLSSARGVGGVGDVVNLMAVDCGRIADATANFHYLWSAAFEVLAILALSFVEIGKSAWPAVGVLILLLPLQAYLGKAIAETSSEFTTTTQHRVHIMSELLTAIKLIKFYAWEPYFRKEINQIRHHEMSLLKRSFFIKSCNFAVVFATPVIVALLCLATYYYTLPTGKVLTSSIVFTVLSVFNTLRYPLLMMPQAVKSSTAAMLAFKRLEQFLSLTEVDTKAIQEEDPVDKRRKDDLVIDMKDASFQWDLPASVDNPAHLTSKDQFSIEKNNTPSLHQLHLQVKRGQLVAVIGEVGNGKSSLVAALLGEMRKTSGHLSVKGRVSYVPQEAWLLNATLRDNILFGSKFDEQRYREVIRVCALERDLTLLASGDQEQIGERGVNLSGGQKQRVSLARAIYFPGEVVVLDDPLSAVDQHVGSHIFEQCIRGFLADRTVVLVTHQLQYLQHCDRVLIMTDGRISEQGTYAELTANHQGTLARLMELDALKDENKELPRDQALKTREEEWIEEYGTLHLVRSMEDGLNLNAYRRDSYPEDDSDVVNIHSTPSISTRTVAHPNHPNASISLSSSVSAPGPLSTHTFVDTGDELLSPIVRSHSTRKRSTHGLDTLPAHYMNNRPHELTMEMPAISNHDRPFSAASSASSSAFPIQRASPSSIHPLYERSAAAVIQRTNRSNMKRPQVSARGRSPHDLVQSAALTVYTQADDHKPDPWVESAVQVGTIQPQENSNIDHSTDRKMGWWTWRDYMAAANGPMLGWSIVFIFCAVHGIRIGSDYWLRLWVPDSLNQEAWVYLVVYAVFCVAFTGGVFGRGMYFVWIMTKKCIFMHNELFHSVMRAPMAFFNATPMGRILNVFAKHVNNVDELLTDSFFQALQYLPLTLGAMGLVAGTIPMMWASLLILFFLMALFCKFAFYTEERFKALDATSKPPVYAHLTASLDGLFSIRSYDASKRFDDIMLAKIDTNHRANYAFTSVQSWIALYMDILSSFYIYASALLIVIYRNDSAVTSATTGLALSNALQMLVFLQWTIRMLGESHACMASVQQVLYYSHEIAEEAPEIVENNRPPKNWPSKGEIEWKNLELRYHRFGVAVLKDVSFQVRAGEKVGIVGRTGSGKSTLLVSLLRIVEASAGSIWVDGVHIAKIGLRDLRSSIAIIPQEPVLFVGTMRSNLDPYTRRTDEEIWAALDKVHLADKIRAMPLGLLTEVIGQSLCLSRSLSRPVSLSI